jgi:hypothetical protein
LNLNQTKTTLLNTPDGHHRRSKRSAAKIAAELEKNLIVKRLRDEYSATHFGSIMKFIKLGNGNNATIVGIPGGQNSKGIRSGLARVIFRQKTWSRYYEVSQTIEGDSTFEGFGTSLLVDDLNKDWIRINL